ncbi:hypothetical protein MTBBW1_1680052 [Desulfamplus magnetovallimortis]|uniref:Uncharacterized protein n=1 Tax=Desulfamplus magnetovallimortis TaxID=1246637 RepID=A0A1W1H9H2_9BACT|nr:hypothetical protein [Desulfamplus magnetovallimortis]SLM29140.1 hypothetical protein MTBBW1_1680052 [Desulfamplus magnetovallimortis]
MARIQIKDLAENQTISKEDLKRVKGGFVMMDNVFSGITPEYKFSPEYKFFNTAQFITSGQLVENMESILYEKWF